MILRFHVPTGPLRPYVAQFVYHEGYTPKHSVERFLPDGSVDLVIDLTDDDKYVFDNRSLEPAQVCRACWVSGMRTRYISISAGKESSMMVISFRAVGAAPCFHVPLSELTDSVVDAESVLGSSILTLRDRLRSLPTPTLRFAAVEKWLMRRLVIPGNGHVLAAAAASMIDTAPQTATVDRAAAYAGVSAKHLVHVFREYAGITPKQYQRIRRFQSVVATVEAKKSVDWAHLAVDCGFYDQSHLIRDFSLFCGMTPLQYMASKGSLLNYIPVA